MKLLLLGCSGFIGRELVPQLIQAGHFVTVVSRKSQRSSPFQIKSENYSYISLNPASAISWESANLQKAIIESEGVINLVGEPIAEKRWTKKHCQLIANSRLDSTKHLINAMVRSKNPPKVLVNGSAIGFYGTSQDAVFSEESSSGKDFLANLCKEWESIAAQKPNRTRLVVIRIGIVLEKDGGALGKMLPIFRSGFGGPLGNGMQWMSWIHRNDLCKIIEKVLTTQSFSGPINCVSPNPVRMNTFTQTLGKSLNRPNLLPVPGAILKLLLGDGAKVVLEGQKVNSKKLKRLGFIFKHPQLESAINAVLNN
ncbi:TIGR01777 family oxidoreductase [Prochlorococcus marinus]|uniref:Putative cell division inhibitor n=1 Tax=Prochlorococcus marinus (strain MIT 9211) TaxID=93059 RepID=A9BCX8_PROM4|nr:TIGR01777 family oxidoreductase [Prochlorococcus marinus]ABX08066.1 putative cell division inhibitor [Prochlorococcus marinus str. MIT 9211]